MTPGQILIVVGIIGLIIYGNSMNKGGKGGGGGSAS